MPEGLHGPNVITAGTSQLLLAVVSEGEAVHLVRRNNPPKAGRGALSDAHFYQADSDRELIKRRYDLAALEEPVWAQTTMCGRAWLVMAGGDGGPVSRYREPAFAPRCRRCLALMDRLFPAPAVDERVPVVAQLVVDLVLRHGYAEVRRVPGDQLFALRKAIRLLIKQQIGQPCRTFVHNDLLMVVCESLGDREAEEQAAAEAVEAALLGREQLPAARPVRNWVVSWSAWKQG
ncbi:hypothetical protein [Micromonospora sp. NPDC005220]|uniref:hypothetical protein n=1 Tax=Micromonospora sp. NPDC005220 TaxID=3155589 RepID=UPI0033BA2310